MAEQPENLLLVYLRRIDANVHELRADMAELKQRQTDMSRQIVGFRREQANDAETVAHLQAQLDRMRDELTRIKRRLEIVD